MELFSAQWGGLVHWNVPPEISHDISPFIKTPPCNFFLGTIANVVNKQKVFQVRKNTQIFPVQINKYADDKISLPNMVCVKCVTWDTKGESSAQNLQLWLPFVLASLSIHYTDLVTAWYHKLYHPTPPTQ